MKATNYAGGYSLVVGLILSSQAGYAGSLLVRGDEAVLAAPIADFRRELKRLQLPPTYFRAVSGQASMAAEISDLRLALEQAGRSSNDIARIIARHTLERAKLKVFEDQLEQARNLPEIEPAQANVDPADFSGGAQSGMFQYEVQAGDTFSSITTRFRRSVGAVIDANPGLDVMRMVVGQNLFIPPETPSLPPFPKIVVATGLPEEFADYLEGAISWRNPLLTDKSMARQAWERLLTLPADQRHFKSVWAAFMLGKTWENDDPVRAVAYYEQVRALTHQGFVDSLGLAAASLGLEAKVYLAQSNYERAIDLYLQQMATGDDSAEVSLCLTMRALTSSGPVSFDSLARNPYTRQVVSAYIISTKALQSSYGNWGSTDQAVSNHLVKIVAEWLTANRQAKVKDSVSAESLALAAYQNGQWTTAQDWISLAGSSSVAQWLNAKLVFRAGKVDQGGALLSQVVAQFPLSALAPNDVPAELKDNLSMANDGRIDAAREVRGEMGVFHVSRGSYAQALSDFLEGGFWMDAAYVAERVLTVDELKAFVDGHQISSGGSEPDEDEGSAWALDQKLRYLLARRLTRTIRGNEAHPYYPPEWQSEFDTLARALLTGWDESLVPQQRVKALFTAARISRSHGMELLGTEVGPDWHISDGNSTETLSAEARAHQSFSLLPASADELSRASLHRADPEVRFHYRYQAAFLAWEAARLLQNDSDETATILCTAGSWLKGRDPQTADLFYKALVRRCGRTALGAEADRKRWFPQIEEAELTVGDPSDDSANTGLEDPAQGLMEALSPEFPVPGKSYLVHEGDTVLRIAEAASAWGAILTVEQLLKANEDLNEDDLRVGQRIMIPEPQ